MRTRLQRILSIMFGLMLTASAIFPAAAADYPYEVQSADSVKLRKYASSSSVVLAYIEAGDTVTLLGESRGYYKAQFNGETGYAMKKYIDGDSLKDDPTYIVSQLSDITDYPYETTTTAKVKMRRKANASASVILVIPKSAIIKVSSVTASEFAKVTYSGKTGYVMTDYINLASAVATPTPIPETTIEPEATKYPVLQFGDTGTFVTALQEALTELRYYKNTVDGKYGSGTKTAVLAFEKKNKLEQDGIADPDLLYLLFEGKPRNYGGYRRTVKTVPPIYGIPLKYGNKGERVKQLQTRLQELGYFDGDITGTFNGATRTALKAFQKKMGIQADGVATTDVQTILYSASALSAAITVTPSPTITATIAPPSDTVRKGDTGQDVKQVQRMLTSLGYYTGKIDGKFGVGTYEAVLAFQTKNSLTADGICGSVTIEALFGGEANYSGGTPTSTPKPTTQIVITEDTVTVVQSGSIGIAVRNIQTRLDDLGYYISRKDGVYLDEDIAAVEAFQQVNGLKVDGIAGYETQKLLFSTKAKSSPVNASAEEGVSQYTSLRYGDTGTAVTEMQEKLIALGYLAGDADGKYGLATKAAVIKFQRENTLVRDGIAGYKTLSALYSSDAEAINTKQTLKEGAVSNTVRQMQQRLVALGYLTDEADGVFGPLTSLALIAFQKDQRLTADGIAGALTLSALNKIAVEKEEEQIAAVAPNVNGVINASSVKYASWYDEIRAVARKYPNVTVYDFSTGISWHITLFSFGAHADGYPPTPEDTQKMYEAFGGAVTWTPKPVWVAFSNGSVYMATTHDMAHGTNPYRDNNFDGHLCIHFPRTAEQVAAIGPYATSHQKNIDLGWTATLAMAVQ
jgi:peptidoglycan hydrolase-like protein with peptidoglycan-binding domain